MNGEKLDLLSIPIVIVVSKDGTIQAANNVAKTVLGESINLSKRVEECLPISIENWKKFVQECDSPCLPQKLILPQGEFFISITAISPQNLYVICLFQSDQANNIKSFLCQRNRFFSYNTQNLEINAGLYPTSDAPGDFYDVFQMPDGLIGIVIGDVSGHGFESAVTMTKVKAALRVAGLHTQDPSKILERTQIALYEDLKEFGHFVTVLLVVIDPQRKLLWYANAGHVRGLLFLKDGTLSKELTSTGPALGLLKGAISTTNGPISLADGMVLLLYTDGIRETINTKGMAFGTKRLIKYVSQHMNLPTSHLIEQVYQEVSQFREGLPQFDDITLVIVRVLENQLDTSV